MNTHRYLWHHWGGMVIPTTWELILDGLPPEAWLKQMEDRGWAYVWGGWVEDTEWDLQSERVSV